MHVAVLKISEPIAHPTRALLLAVLKQTPGPIEITLEYIDDLDVFSPGLVMELSENTGVNKYVLELIKGKQSLYSSIYSLSQVELGNLKIDVDTPLKTGFI